MTPFIQNSRQCILSSNDWKHFSGCLGTESGEQEVEIPKGHKDASGCDRDIHYLAYGETFISVYICQSLPKETF